MRHLTPGVSNMVNLPTVKTEVDVFQLGTAQIYGPNKRGGKKKTTTKKGNTLVWLGAQITAVLAMFTLKETADINNIYIHFMGCGNRCTEEKFKRAAFKPLGASGLLESAEFSYD